MKNDSDQETTLIQSAQCGDLEAFNLLILRHQSFLFGIALRLLNDEDVAADAVQEALVSAFRKFDTFRGGSLKSWLARIVVNASYDEMRRKRRQPAVPLDQLNEYDEEIESHSWLVDPNAGLEEGYEHAELKNAIEECLGSIPFAYRVIVTLVDIEGMPYEEAAQAAGIPIGTVKSRLARARIQLRQRLNRFGDLLPAAYQVELSSMASV